MPDTNQLIMNSLLGTALPIIVVTLVVIVIVFIVVRNMTGAGDKAVLASGQPAEAVILKMWDTGVTVNDNPRVGLLLEVRPQGRQPFQVETKKVISRLQTSQYQPGQMLEVKYDPNDTRKVAVSAILAGGGVAGMPGMAMGADQAGTAQLQASLMQQDQRNQQLVATGQPARAKVLTMQPTGIMINGTNPYASLSLEVYPEGRASFVAQTQAAISAQSLPKYQPGSMIYVRFDPNDMTRVAIEHS